MLGVVRTAFITLGTTLVEFYCQVLLIVNDCLELWQKHSVAEDGFRDKKGHVWRSCLPQRWDWWGSQGPANSCLFCRSESELYQVIQQPFKISKPSGLAQLPPEVLASLSWGLLSELCCLLVAVPRSITL